MPDPRCDICDKPLNDVAIRNEDPFCSTECARVSYGNPLPKVSIYSLTKTRRTPRSGVSENPGFVESEIT